MIPARLIITPEMPGPVNMAIDTMLARRVGAFESRPTLRFYSWKPHCISLGYHQDASDLDFRQCRESNIDVVRRPTGGRAVFHGDEFTYSIVFPTGRENFGESIRATHAKVAAWLVHGLRRLGIRAELAMKKPRTNTERDFGMACFVRAYENEVVVENRKLVGSAQRRWPEVVLQHGSILVRNNPRRSAGALKMNPYRRKRLEALLRATTTCLSEHLQCCPVIEDFAFVMAESWSEVFDCVMEPEVLIEDEKREAKALLDDFRSDREGISNYSHRVNEYATMGGD